MGHNDVSVPGGNECIFIALASVRRYLTEDPFGSTPLVEQELHHLTVVEGNVWTNGSESDRFGFDFIAICCARCDGDSVTELFHVTGHR